MVTSRMVLEVEWEVEQVRVAGSFGIAWSDFALPVLCQRCTACPLHCTMPDFVQLCFPPSIRSHPISRASPTRTYHASLASLLPACACAHRSLSDSPLPLTPTRTPRHCTLLLASNHPFLHSSLFAANHASLTRSLPARRTAEPAAVLMRHSATSRCDIDRRHRRRTDR